LVIHISKRANLAIFHPKWGLTNYKRFVPPRGYGTNFTCWIWMKPVLSRVLDFCPLALTQKNIRDSGRESGGTWFLSLRPFFTISSYCPYQ